MKTLCIIIVLVTLFLVLCFIGYRVGTKDQKYERDTGRDFASHRDRDFGGGMYGGGYGGEFGRPRTRGYDDSSGPYDLNAPIDDDTAEESGEGDYEDFPADEPKAPEF